ncbi:MAG: hypothetical protein ACJA1L_001297 [Paracoccaceae bacterium]|jgi:hypothetical protein
MSGGVDTHSATWREVQAKANACIAADARLLEGRGRDAIETEFLRGRIAAYRSILSLADNTRQG